MTEINKLIYELIQVSLGRRACLSRTPSESQWHELYAIAKKQSLVGVCFAGVQKLVEQQQTPEEMLYLTWMGMAAKIQQKNEVVNRQCVTLGKMLQEAGMEYVVMKGQAIGRYYHDLSALRQSGDIDVWITNKSREEIVAFANKKTCGGGVTHQHVHYHVFNETEVELHYIPAELHCPWYDKALMLFFRSQMEGFHLCEAGYMVPAMEFDLLHQLAHSFRHLFGDGIGMRQVMDFYMVLCTSLKMDVDWNVVSVGIHSTGMKRFASAMLWMTGEVFGMTTSDISTIEGHLRLSADERFGSFLLSEVLLAGNFGHTDERINRDKHESAWHRFWRVNMGMKTKRAMVEEVDLCVNR